MTIAYKFRIYPSNQVKSKIDNNLELCRFTYNKLLNTLNEAKKQDRKLSKVETQAMIVQFKEEHPELKHVYSKVLQMVNYTLWSNILGLSKRKKKGGKIGRLRFKGKDWYKTLNFNQSGFKIDKVTKRIKLSKIGEMPMKAHRKIKGNIKGIIIKKESNKYYAILQSDYEKEHLPKTNKSVGIDLGVSKFITDSDGVQVESPKFMHKTLDRIKLLQKKVSQKKKGSQNRKKAKLRLSKLYDKLINQRKDFLHKTALYYVKNYDEICVEDLNVQGLTQIGKIKTLNRNILDSSFGEFLNVLTCKAESAGKLAIKINPKNTSQRCSQCGKLVKKTLRDRVHDCPYCNCQLDRDYNASLNILALGQGLSLMPVEREPLLKIISYKDIVSGQVFLTKQEAPSLNL